MLYFSFGGTLVSAIFAASIVIPQYISAPQITVEYPAQTATTTAPVKPIASQNCIKYAQLIEQYEWPVETAMQICKDESAGDHKAVGDTATQYVSRVAPLVRN
jgi:hypothetical protein